MVNGGVGGFGVVRSLEFADFLPGCYQWNGASGGRAEYGIHPKIYLLTERGMTEQGRDKFFTRMLTKKEEVERFALNRPSRNIDEQREELRLIREQAEGEMPEIHWDRVYISEEDVIFPVENQWNWWKDRCEVISLAGGHYPFYVLDNWEMIWK